MAVSISISSITQNSQNIANNTSNVTVKLVCKWTYGTYNHYGRANGWLQIDGTKYTFSGVIINANKTTSGSQTLITKTVNVGHNADGTKTLACSAWFDTDLNSTGELTTSASKTLTTIPRASTPSVSSTSVDMGSAVTINTNRVSSSFTHDLAYSFAGASYVSIATGVGASYRWTTPDLASQIPNATSGTVTIRCITKNGSTTVGTKTVTMTLKVPTSVVPTISSVATTEATSGLAAQFGAFIKNKSTIKSTITAAGAKGSTIKRYSTTFNGKTYTGNSWTSAAVTASGPLQLVTTVTDSRGRTAKKTTTITVLDYAAPTINLLKVYRVDTNGTADPEGVYIAVQYKYSVTSLGGKNTCAMTVDYKQSTASSWVRLLSGSALSADTTTRPTTPTFSTDYQYNVRLTITDWFGSSRTYTATLDTGAVILDIRADGKGLAFGKTAERVGVDFGWPARGQVFGLGQAKEALPEGADLNDYYTPGVYAVERNDIATTLAHCPSTYAGTLRVYNAIGKANITGAWVYVLQEYRPYPPNEPTYQRLLQTGDNGSWTASDWFFSAAPAGFGLGQTTLTDCEGNDANNALRNGKYNVYTSTTNGPGINGALEVTCRTYGAAHQLAIEDSTGCMLYRHQIAGEWQPWEWTNPPMTLGVEYRTTERWKGSAVYTKAIDFGALPNATSKSVGTGASSSKIFRSFVNILSSDGSSMSSPYFLADGKMVVKHLFSGSNVQISTTTDYSSRSAVVQIWYTK